MLVPLEGILHSYEGDDFINHYKHPCSTTSISWKVRPFLFSVAQMVIQKQGLVRFWFQGVATPEV